MTAAPATPDAGDLIREFRRHLPAGVFAELNDTQRVVALVYRLVTDDGWTPQQLAKRAGRNLGGVASPGGVLTHRLEQLVGHLRPDDVHGKPATRPFCGTCEAGWLLDPQTRLPAARCPCRTTEATP